MASAATSADLPKDGVQPPAKKAETFPSAPVKPSAAEDAAAKARSTANAAPEQAAKAKETAKPEEKDQETASAEETEAVRPGDKPNPVIATAAEWPKGEDAPTQKKKGLLSFFGASPAEAAPSPIVQPPDRTVDSAPKQAVIENRPGMAAARTADARPAKPIIDMDAPVKRRPVELASLGDDNGLPGVRQTMLFEIKRKSGIDDDSDIDLHEEEEYGPVRVAYSAGLARLAPNGLLKQTESVDTACLKPTLVKMLKTIERRFGRKVIITSGYRSRAHNVRVRGAKNSMHMYCAAADIQLPGVSKWDIATFARSLPGRGGVGTYCHTNSVHVDVGPERDWNWKCRRRKA